MIHLGDITKIDWAQVEPVDCVTGGSPCQDLKGCGQSEIQGSGKFHRSAVLVLAPAEDLRTVRAARHTGQSV